MSDSLRSLINSGTKLWLDSVDPDLVLESLEQGVTGATSNPIIIADIIQSGRFDQQIRELKSRGLSTSDVAWKITDHMVSEAEKRFQPVFQAAAGEDGYVSFEVDPLLEDVDQEMNSQQRAERYVELAKKWSQGHTNRLIKIPATEAGLMALPSVVAAGVNVNITLIFSLRQHAQAVEAVWQGLRERKDNQSFKSVFSIFVSRLDVYTEKHNSDLSAESQGLTGIVNAKRVWVANNEFWNKHPQRLKQEIVFASTGTKKPSDAPWKYVEALAGSDIQTNPPGTNHAVRESDQVFTRQIDQWPDRILLDEIDGKVNFDHLEQTLMAEGLAKFAEPQKQLLALIDGM